MSAIMLQISEAWKEKNIGLIAQEDEPITLKILRTSKDDEIKSIEYQIKFA